ncbi:MAG: hypothetical protein IKK39_06665 [Thermoguttaceae bacterium]|nr:hypothetical protein [Thermoguttaceae bacterium]
MGKIGEAGGMGRNEDGGKGTEAEADALDSTAKNDQKTESTLARFVGRFGILAGEKRFDRREGGVGNVAFGAEKKEPTVAFRLFFKEKIE